jgi:hypothetical protein
VAIALSEKFPKNKLKPQPTENETENDHIRCDDAYRLERGAIPLHIFFPSAAEDVW